MSEIKFRVAAKTDVGLLRTNNEDNFQVASDLASGQMRWVNNEVCSLGDKGALLVVADGMGGMNAGEVASDLAIQAVREFFSAEKLTADVMKNRFSIEKHMNAAIVAADAAIKDVAKQDPETRGMGTTIVIAWLLDGKLYVSWCGDSRAYIYNPAAGLHQITKDHSYVQKLVDKGSISREDAFDFPDSNIITRSLSDASGKAKPESLLKPYDLCNGDIILLCTDGLNGMIRDNEMEEIIRANEDNMDVLVDALIQGACDAEGSDNITICVCQILEGGGECNPAVFEESEKRLNGPQGSFLRSAISEDGGNDLGGNKNGGGNRRKWIWAACASVGVLMAGAGVWYFLADRQVNPDNKGDSTVLSSDSAKVDSSGNVETEPEPGISNSKSDTPVVISAREKKKQEGEISMDEENIRQINDSLNRIKGDEKKDTITRVFPADSMETPDSGATPDVAIPEEYEIQRGDYSWSRVATSINNKYNAHFNAAELQAANPNVDFQKTVKAGQRIKIPKNKNRKR